MIRINPERVFVAISCLLFVICSHAVALAEMTPAVTKIVASMERAVDPDNKAAKISTYIIHSEADLKQQQVKISSTVKFKRSNKMLSIVSIPGAVSIKQGYNGTFGWIFSPAMGVMPEAGDQLLSTQFMTKMSAPDGKFKDLFSKITVAKATVKVNNVDCYKLTCTIPAKFNMPPAILYVDKKTFLTVKTEITLHTMMGPVTTPVTVLKYKKIHGIMWPEISQSKTMGMMVEMKLKSVQVNINIPDSEFQPPKVKNTAMPLI
jgi:outer membrane lipoprotein-sorting protein